MERCPDHPEYGQQILAFAKTYTNVDFRPDTYRDIDIPHGEEIEVLHRVGYNGVSLIRHKARQGYVHSMFIVDYDPAEGVRPDPSSCHE